MTAKRKQSKGAPSGASARMIEAKPGTKPVSYLRILAESTKGKERQILFGAIAERVRSCMLDPDEADIIAGLFDRLAAGEKPDKVLRGETRGRPKRATGTKTVRGNEVRLPDHADLCWSIRHAHHFGHSLETIFAHVAKLYGVTKDHVADVYAQVLPTLADDQRHRK